MRVLIAPNAFKGTLSAAAAAAAIATGWRRGAPVDETDQCPLSDGGPGFLEVLHPALGGELVSCVAAGPHGATLAATALLVGDTGYVEAAQACGLAALPDPAPPLAERDTSGVGDLVLAAAGLGASTVVVGVGGTATNDGGAGLLVRLGWRLLAADGRDLPPRPGALVELAVARPAPVPVRLVLASDVDNPLLGPHGATRTYAPQKGARREELPALEAVLARLAAAVATVAPAGSPGAATPGAGAGGGLGFGLLAAGATRVSGFELVADAVRLRERVARAELVVTGEGCFDEQSMHGKGPAGVAALAAAAGVPCLVLAGAVEVGRRRYAAAGVAGAYSATALAPGEPTAAATLSAAASRLAAEWGGRQDR